MTYPNILSPSQGSPSSPVQGEIASEGAPSLSPEQSAMLSGVFQSMSPPMLSHRSDDEMGPSGLAEDHPVVSSPTRPQDAQLLPLVMGSAPESLWQDAWGDCFEFSVESQSSNLLGSTAIHEELSLSTNRAVNGSGVFGMGLESTAIVDTSDIHSAHHTLANPVGIEPQQSSTPIPNKQSPGKEEAQQEKPAEIRARTARKKQRKTAVGRPPVQTGTGQREVDKAGSDSKKTEQASGPLTPKQLSDRRRWEGINQLIRDGKEFEQQQQEGIALTLEQQKTLKRYIEYRENKRNTNRKIKQRFKELKQKEKNNIPLTPRERVQLDAREQQVKKDNQRRNTLRKERKQRLQRENPEEYARQRETQRAYERGLSAQYRARKRAQRRAAEQVTAE